MKFTIEVVPPDQCRNQQAGDWRLHEDGSIDVLVVEMPTDSAICVGIHELIEARRCFKDNVSDQQVTQFDMMFEHERSLGKHSVEAEAGDDERACYHNQHESATFVERAAACGLELSWEKHERDVLRSLV